MYKMKLFTTKTNKADLLLLYEKNVENIKNAHNMMDESIENKIKNLDKLEKKEQCQMFLNVVSEDGKHIEFWKFFEYMKDRTGDIKNIEFTD